VRTSQPFTIESLALAPSRGAVTLVVMHDAIAYDCLHLAPADLHQLWSFVMQFSDGVVYVSEFSRQQLAQRFATSPDVAHIICMPSTDVADYAKARPNGGGYLLIVGNGFAHKALLDTVGLIRGRFPALKLGVFGALGADQDNVVHFPDGQLSSEEVAAIFANASAVIYPSHYEGFGFPIMQALANGKRIFARDLPVYHEIKHKVAAPDNIHLFKDNDALLDEIAMADFAWRAPRQTGAAEGWEVAAQHLEALVRDKLQGANAEKIERRLAALDNLYAGITGRLAQTTLQERVTHLENLAAHRQQHLDALHRSSSWRITKPLRALGRMLTGRK
jgi:glycosyltransferase involved in cell wall biosynthesis